MPGGPQPLKVGIAGVGWRASAFATALAADARVRLVAVQDPVREARDRFAAAHGVEIACSSFGELVEHVDLVILVTPLPYHAPQACHALAHDVHVLSEVPAVISHEQAQELLAAVRSSKARYGLAENYCYMTRHLIARELVRAGELGELYYGESDHLADFKSHVRNADGTPHWTYHWWMGRDGNTYPTHSLGPLLQLFEDRVTAVSCVGSGHHEAPEHELQDTTVLLARTVKGALLRVRFSWLSSRPMQSAYGVQGTRGALELGDPLRGVQPAIYLEGRTPRDTWEPLEPFASRLPERYAQGASGPLYAEEDAFEALFGSADAWLVRDFVDAIGDDRAFDLDIYAALDMTLPGLAAEVSAAQNGDWIHVPNPRLLSAGIGVDAGREFPLA